MEGGRSPPPVGVGGTSYEGYPPPGHTPCPTTPAEHTTYDCSDNGSIDHITKIITNLASKYPPDDPIRLILTCLLKTLLPLCKEITSLNHHNKALNNKLDNIIPALKHTVNLHSTQQPSWSAIAAGGPPEHVRLQPQGPPLAAVTAPIALKSPPQHYQRELVAHCNKDAGALECSIQRLVEDLNRATRQSEAIGELQSVRKLQSGDVILRFDTTESRDSWRRCEKDWIKVLGVGAHLKERHYTVLIHGMKKRECQDSDSTIAELYQTNTRLQDAGVRILTAAFRKKTLASDKSAGPLLITVSEPEHANEMVRQEINWRYQAHHCELFEGNAKPTQCFKCYGFGHLAIHCRHTQRCGYCSRTGHKPDDCIAKEDSEAHKCTNCKGKHAAWHRECPTVINQRTQAQAAFNNRPTRYRVDMPATKLPPPQTIRTSASLELDNRPSITPTEEGLTQPPQKNRRAATLKSLSHNATMTANTSGESMDRRLTPRLDATSPRPIETVQQPPAPSISYKRARTASQRYTYSKITPSTEETTFAERIEAARTDATWHERRTRRSTATAMCSQSSEICEDSETTPMEVDLA